jgi:hypothetical protein
MGMSAWQQQQIPPLRCGMTNKRANNGNSNCSRSDQWAVTVRLRVTVWVSWMPVVELAVT